MLPFSLLLSLLIVADVEGLSACWSDALSMRGRGNLTSVLVMLLLLMLLKLIRSLLLLLLLLLVETSIWIESLLLLLGLLLRLLVLSWIGLFKTADNDSLIVEIVCGDSHLNEVATTLLLTAASSIISIAVLLMTMVIVWCSRRFLLNRRALMMCAHIVSGAITTTATIVAELDRAIVVGLEAWLLVESVFETHTIVCDIARRLIFAGGSTTPNLSLNARVSQGYTGTNQLLTSILSRRQVLQCLIWVSIEVLESFPKIYEFGAVARTGCHGKELTAIIIILIRLLPPVVVAGPVTRGSAYFEFELSLAGRPHLLSLHCLVIIGIIVLIILVVIIFFINVMLMIASMKWPRAALPVLVLFLLIIIFIVFFIDLVVVF